MKTPHLILLTLLMACSKNNAEAEPAYSADELHAPYDTVAIDSFSAGATASNVVIRKDTFATKPQDSLKKTKTTTSDPKDGKGKDDKSKKQPAAKPSEKTAATDIPATAEKASQKTADQ